MAEIYKQIKDFTLKNSIDGTEDILIQSNGVTMRVKSSQLKTSIDLSNYYTKSEVDNLLANIDVNIDMADYYDKATIDNLLLNKANVSHTHTSADITDLSIPTVDVDKAYVDSQLANKSNTNHTHDEYISETELNEKGYATETYVQTKIAEVATGGTVDLSNYATKTELTTELNKKANLSHTHNAEDINGLNIPTKLSELQNDSGFISEIPSEYINETELNNALANKANTSDIPSLAGYATESFVTNKIAEASLSGGEVDLSGYATKDDLLLKANSTHTHTTSDITGLVIPTVDVNKAYVDSQLSLKANVSEVPTKTSELINDSGFITTIPTEYVTETELNSSLSTKANTSDIPSLTGYATETYVMNKLGGKSLIYLTQSEYDLLSDTEKQDSTKVYNITDAVIDYNELANTPTIPTKTSELNNDSGFITSVPSEYVTETELNAKGYLTSHQDISNLQEKTDDALNTTDKTVVGAINELFQSVNNGKNRLEAAIIDVGGTVSKSGSIATFDEIINAISELSSTPITLNSIKVLKDNWKFKLINNVSNLSYSSTDETQSIYDDSTWKTISTPHDWSIYNEFNSSSACGYEGGYLDGGDAWYRRKLNTSDLSEQKVYLYFDGIYMESDVYINGVKIISNKWYNPFCVEITNYLNFNSNDTLTIFVRNQQPSSRWYSGSGIIRNVYLVTGNDVEVGLHDVKITYPNLETEYNSDVNTVIDLTIKNKNSSTDTYKIKNTLYYNGSQVATKEEDLVLTGSESQSFTTNLTVNKPNLWDEYIGNLYTLKTEILKNNKTYYRLNTKFGYRYFKFDKDTGFWLNGKNIKLRGVCLHHDLGCIGAEVNKSAIERQLNLLIDMGANAIRITHNPGSSELLDLCAEKGLLVVEEFFDCWTSSKKAYDFARYYNDNYEKVIETTVKRGINNPSIIMWSLGNEIIRTSTSYTAEQATTFVNNMKTKVKSLDTTRMVTMGEDLPNNEVAVACMELMDVVGINYGNDFEYSTLRNDHPDFKLYGSETTSALSSRGVYARDAANKQCSSFDDDNVDWGDPASTALKRHMDNDYIAGMFVWTGFDYIGEPTPFNAYPSRSSYFGIIDLAGFPKDIYYMYQSRWTNNPMIHILPHWDDSSATKVWLYSNCDSVELFLNGTSLGKKQQTEIGTKYQFEYNPTYVKGTLVANGYNSEGEIVAQDVVYTSLNIASSIQLKSDKSSVNINSDDLIFITCNMLDSNDNIIPNADNEVTFSVEGGTIIGTDNGDATCITKMRTNIKKAFNGKLLCVVKHDGLSGTLIVKANSNGLPEQTISVTKSNVTLLNDKEQTTFIDATNPPIYDYNIPCTSISLNKTSLSFTDSVAQNLIATPLPSNTSDSIVWSVAPTGIVDVASGLVSPLSNGEATITVTCGSQSATCNVSVNISSAGGFFDGISVASDYTCDGTKFSHELPSEVTPLSSTIFVDVNIESSKTNNSNIISYGTNIGTWNSSSIHFYYKSADDNLTIQGAGTTLCTFSVADINNVKIAINSNGIVINGVKQTLSSQMKFNDIINANTGTWTIGSMEGSARSTATYNTIGYYTSLKTEEEMIALTTIYKQDIPCTSISLDKETLTFTNRVAQNLTATVNPSDTSDKIVWSVNPDGIVSVENGIVTPIANGDAIITATCGNYSDTCSVNVNIDSSSSGGFEELVSNYTGNGTRFSYELPSTVNPTTSTIFADFDIESARTNLMNILSCGTEITQWQSTSVHIYYKESGDMLSLEGNRATICTFSTNGTNHIKFAFNSNGIFINGVKQSSNNLDAIISATGTWYVGSSQGNTLSTATYASIGYYTSVKTEEELIALTTI